MATDLDGARRGDLRAFNRVAAAHYEQLYTLSYRLLGDEAAAADAAQAGLAQAARQMRHFNGGPIYPWLLRWVVSACQQRQGDGGPRQPGLENDLGTTRPVDLQDRLCALPGDLRMAILLVDVSGLDYGTAAALLGLSREQVRQRVAQARGRLLDRTAA